jgi:SAM-dependent methyltransferase
MPVNPNASQPENWYSRVFARIYDPFMGKMEERVLQKRRRALLEDLEGDILEVGAGTGANFEWYPPSAKVIAIEPAGYMLRQAEEKVARGSLAAQFVLLEAGIGDDSVTAAIPPGGLDAVVFTLVLCTIPDPEAALRQCISWLKPGGKVILLEHIASKDKWGYLLQQTIDPVWNHLAEGCHLDRHTDILIQNMGLHKISEEHFTKALPFYKAVWQK